MPDHLDTEEAMLARINRADGFASRMEAFMLESVSHQARAAKSFSNISSSLQRQEGRLDTLTDTCTAIKERIAVNATEIGNLKTVNSDQWTEINKVKNGARKDDDEKGFSFSARNVSAQDVVRVLMVIGVLWLILRGYHIDPVTLLAKVFTP